MKSNWLKVILIISFFAFLIIAGCAPSTPTPPVVTGPITCSLTIYSQSYYCYGYVWANGISTGKYLDYNGAVQITVPCGVVSVELRDEYGYISHPEIVQTPQTSFLIFTYW